MERGRKGRKRRRGRKNGKGRKERGSIERGGKEGNTWEGKLK